MEQTKKLLLSPCGCLTLFLGDEPIGLDLLDSDLLPSDNICIVWIKFDGVEYEIEQIFTDITDLLNYLNTTFVAAYGFEGVFTFDDGFITYSNNENFTSAEIMAIIQNKMLRFAMGSAPTLNVPVVAVPNNNTLTHISLMDVEVLSVQVNTINSVPSDFEGWSFDDGAGTLTFPTDNPPHDSNIFVLVKQTL